MENLYNDYYAFPCQSPTNSEDWSNGMSMLDYFAAKALPAVIAKCGHPYWKLGPEQKDEVVKEVYEIAVHMLKQREELQ